MTNLNSLSKAELVEKLTKAVTLIQKQQKQINKYSELVNIFEENKNGTFSAVNWIEDELLIMSWKKQGKITISQKTHTNWFYGLLENTINLIKSKEYFEITVNENIKIGSAKGASYFIDVDWNKISDAKKIYLNNKNPDLNIPVTKQDNRYIRDEEAEEINQFIYGLTGRTIEY